MGEKVKDDLTVIRVQRRLRDKIKIEAAKEGVTIQKWVEIKLTESLNKTYTNEALSRRASEL